MESSLSLVANSNNQITTFSYDASGNTLNDTHNSYTWNAESEIQTAAGVTYTYDGDGDRVQKSSGKIYCYGAGSEILDESDSSGNFTDEYVYFGGKRVAHRVVSGNSIYYYGEDFLGTSRQIFTSASALCYDADFYPFGGERAYTTTCTPTYKFEGKERDTETNNDDFGARYYSSSFGRWTSPDWSAIPAPVPYSDLTNPQTLNIYAMVSDNPETFVDLDGHFWRELLNYMKTGECYCDAAQMKAYVEQRRAWLTEHVVSLDGGKHRADFSKLTDDQVLHEYDFVTCRIEEGRYTVEGQPPNIPGTPVGDVPDVNWGPQEKHFEGHNSYQTGRSTLTANPEELAAQAGTGTPVNDVPRGQPGFKERVDFGKVIGNFVDRNTGESMPKTKGIIHYSKNGIHIVPAHP